MDDGSSAHWSVEQRLSATGLEDAAGGRGDSITNADAERVLLRVKQKLEGLEGGALAPISVAGVRHALLCMWGTGPPPLCLPLSCSAV